VGEPAGSPAAASRSFPSLYSTSSSDLMSL
jgi:hypothetical protein